MGPTDGLGVKKKAPAPAEIRTQDRTERSLVPKLITLPLLLFGF